MDQVNVYLEPVRAFMYQLGAFLPRLGIAVVVLLVGFLLAKAARFAVVKGLRAINFHILTQRAGIDGFLQRGGASFDGNALLGLLTYVFVLLAALTVAFNGLGLAYVTELIGRVMLFVPRVVVALLIVAFGAYFARFIGQAVQGYLEGARLQDGELLGRVARYAMLAFVLMLALEEMDIGGALVRHTFLILLAGVVLALALAFGLGGRDWAAARLEAWWPSDPREGGDPR